MSLSAVITISYIVIGIFVGRGFGGHVYYKGKGSGRWGADPSWLMGDAVASGIAVGLCWPLLLLWYAAKPTINFTPAVGAERQYKQDQKIKALQARKDKLAELERELELDD